MSSSSFLFFAGDVASNMWKNPGSVLPRQLQFLSCERGRRHGSYQQVCSGRWRLPCAWRAGGCTWMGHAVRHSAAPESHRRVRRLSGFCDHPLGQVRLTALLHWYGTRIQLPGSGLSAGLLRDLTKQKFELRKSLAPAVVLDGIQLVCGDNSSMEKKV